jgi:hypothetical protein
MKLHIDIGDDHIYIEDFYQYTQFLAYFPKMKIGLSVCFYPLITFESIGRVHEIRQGGHAIAGNLSAIFFTSQLQQFQNGGRSSF